MGVSIGVKPRRVPQYVNDSPPVLSSPLASLADRDLDTMLR